MANLLKWGKDRVKEAQGVYHQLNPVDGGRTYDTNQRGAQPTQQQPTQQLRQADNRNIIQRTVDQINPADQNRTWKQQAPVGANRSAFKQITDNKVTDVIGDSVVKPTLAQADRAATMINETPVGRLTGMPSRSQQIEDLANQQKDPRVADAIRTKGYQDLLGDSGIGINDDKKTIFKKAVSDIGGTVANVIPVGNAAKGAMGAKALLRPVAESAAAGATASGLATAHDTNDIREIAKSTILGGALGGAFPVAGMGMRKVAQEILPGARGAVDALNPTNAAAKHPAVQELDLKMNDLNAQRGNLMANGMPENHPTLRANAEAYQMALSEKNNTMQQITQGGYIRTSDGADVVPVAKPDNYGMSHRPSEDGPRGFDMTENGMLGKDYYDNPQYYGANLKEIPDQESLAALQAVRGNPEADITVYRAGPKDELNQSDWISPSKSYAEQEALAEGTKVHAFTVKAKDIKNAGDSINEFGFFPEQIAEPKGRFGMKPLNEEGFAKVPGRKGPQQPEPGKAVLKQNLSDSSKETQTIRGKTDQGKLPQKQSQVPLKDVPQQPSKTSGPPAKLNVDKFNITKKEKKALSEVTEGMAEDIKAKVGSRLTNKEVRELADTTKTVMKNGKTRAQTAEYNAKRLRLADDVAALAKKRKSGKLTNEEAARLNKGVLELKAAATDAGRTLQLHKEMANPNEVTVLDTMIDKIQKQTDDLDGVAKELEKLGANPTPKELAAFYRKFVKATKEDWLDKYRYTNMLSSPLTHVVNTVSNMTGVAGVAPAQKLFEGGADAIRAGVTRTPRKQFASEAGAYYKGVADSFSEAIGNAKGVMTGERLTQNPDMDSLRNVPLAVEGKAAAFDKILSFVPKLLEAGDQFGTTLAKGGESAAYAKRIAKGVSTIDVPEVKNVNGKRVTTVVNKKITPDTIDQLTTDAAKYRVFRQEMKKAGQGRLLDMIDTPVNALQKFRQDDNPYIRNFTKFTIPFIATPTNLFKQGIEYSPAGILTLHGNKNKTAQSAKAVMGATAMATIAGALAAGGDITFGEPSNADQRNAFRAEGKQPYAFKVPGTNHWVNYSKAHPAIAANFAIVAATKDMLDKGSITDSGAEKLLNLGGGIVNYYTDQSYMKNVGDIVNIFQGKDNTNAQTIVSSQATNTANQLMPLKSLTSWLGRMADSTQRKVDSKANTATQIYQGIIKDIPGLNSNVPTRDNPYTGEPLKNQYPGLNAFSPNRITKDLGYGNTTGLNIDQRELIRDLPKGEKEAYRRSIVEEKATLKSAKEEEQAIKDGREVKFKATDKKEDAKGGDIKQLSSGKYMGKVDGEFKKFDSKEKAQKAVEGSKFKNGKEDTKVVGDNIYIKDDSDQGYTVKKKVQYDYDNIDSKESLNMDRAKEDDNIDGWLDSAQKKFDALENLKKSYNSKTEQSKIDDITNKQEDIKRQADKYQGYGGFTKPKAAKKGKGGRAGASGFQAPKGGGIDGVSTAIKVNKLVTSGKVTGKRLRRKF